MKIDLLLKIIVGFCAVFFSFSTHSQVASNQKAPYYWFDEIIGLNNTGLYKGIEYREEYRFFTNEYHKFFLENKFYLGNILYDGEYYYNVEMKYDLYEDNVLVKILGESKYLFITLITELIENFSIKNHNFIKITDNKKGLENGFFELIYKSKKITCLKKNVKKSFKVYEENNLSYKFLKKNYYTIIKNETSYEISSKSSIIKVFPKKKKTVNSFFKNNKDFYKNNRGIFFKQLLKKLEDN